MITKVPGIGLASIHFPAVFRTCRAATFSCQRMVKHLGGGSLVPAKYVALGQMISHFVAAVSGLLGCVMGTSDVEH